MFHVFIWFSYTATFLLGSFLCFILREVSLVYALTLPYFQNPSLSYGSMASWVVSEPDTLRLARLLVNDFITHVFPEDFLAPSVEETLTHVLEARPYEQYDAKAIFIIWSQITALGIFTIWARTVGPRFRPDQMSDITWKDILVVLVCILISTISVSL